MAQEPTGTTSPQGETGWDGLIERARQVAGEWHCVPGYKWELRFLPPGANRGGARFEIRRAKTDPKETDPKREYRQYLYTPGRPKPADSPGGAVLHSDLSADVLPDGAQALADAVVRSLRKRPPRSWKSLASAFEWLAPDFFGLCPTLSRWKRFAYSLAGSATFFGMMALITWPDTSPPSTRKVVLVSSLPVFTLFYAFICSRNEHWHSPVRVYLFAFVFPLIVWILATQIDGSGLFS